MALPTQPRPPSTAPVRRLVPRLWKLVVAIWAAHHLAFLPLILLSTGLLRDLGLAAHDIAPADLVLIAADHLAAGAFPLAVATASGLLGWWLWTVLWHAGAVTWRVWGSPGPVQLAAVVGHGMIRWWPFFRLHVLACGVTASVVGGVWALAVTIARVAGPSVSPAVVAGAVALCVACGLAVGAATLAGCWRLAAPAGGVATVALWQGLRLALQHPVATGGTMIAWMVLAMGLAWLPVAVAAQLPWTVWLVVLELSLAGRALCRLALLAAFEPCLGLGDDEPPSTGVAGQRGRRA